MMQKFPAFIFRVPVLYAAVAVVGVLMFDVGDMIATAQLKTLNRLRYPEMTEVAVFAENPQAGDFQKLEKHWFYYKKVSQFLPKETDHIGLWGFCSFYLGKYDEAVKAYKMALKQAPGFFWFHHNLGIVYYHQKNYVLAAEHFHQALASDPNLSIQFILASRRLYLPMIFAQTKDVEAKVKGDLKQGYEDVQKLLVKSYEAAGEYKEMVAAAQSAITRSEADRAFFFYYAGVAELKLGRYPQALAFLKQAADLQPENPEVFEQLAAVVKQMGNQVLAQQFMAMESERRQSFPQSSFDINNIQLQPY